MVNCTKCGKVILRQERGNVKSSRDVDGFEHKDCSIAIGPFPDNPIINAPKPSIKPKDTLRSMEKRYCQSVINSVTLWALGDPENGIYPEDEHFERLAEMLQQPGQAMNIIWPKPIEANVIEPKLTNALDPKKHDSVDKDILNALGIPVAKTVVMEPETDNNIVPFQYKAIEEFMEDESR